MYTTLVPILFLSIASVSTLKVTQCKKGLDFKNLEQRVKVSNCHEVPCTLMKGRNTKIEMIFTPAYDTTIVKNDVKAYLNALPDIGIPFPGVDGANACDQIYLASDHKKKVGCPLKAGTEYIYKSTFFIQKLYPSWSMTVAYGLIGSKNDHLMCFRVPAEIKSPDDDEDDDE